MSWDYQKWGTLADPIHKSDLQQLTSDFGCPEQLRRDRNGDRILGQADRVNGSAILGTAGHEVIAKLLQDGEVCDTFAARGYLCDALEREAEGRAIDWYGDDPNGEIEAKAAMIAGLSAQLWQRIGRVLGVECGWIAPMGQYWLEGHCDLVYEPRDRPGTVAGCDWKFGAARPDPIELQHGWEGGLYAYAIKHGRFFARDMIESWKTPTGWAAYGPHDSQIGASTRAGAVRLAMHAHMRDAADQLVTRGQMLTGWPASHGQYPSSFHRVQLADFLPYTRAGARTVERPEECEFYGCEPGTKIKYKAGDLRGPGWYAMGATEADIPRLASRIGKAVRMVRMGVFLDRVDERCRRCRHRQPCHTDGYLGAEERAKLGRSLRVLDAVADDGGIGI